MVPTTFAASAVHEHEAGTSRKGAASFIGHQLFTFGGYLRATAHEDPAATNRWRRRCGLVWIAPSPKTIGSMKNVRLICSFFAAAALTIAAFAADPTGTWKWTTHSPNGDIDTTLKLDVKDGKVTGAYSNQFGDATISNASLHDDVIAFDVAREYGGNPFVVKYRGKIEGDTIKGTIEAPRPDGGEAMKLDWNAKRAASEKPAEAKPSA